MNTTEKNIKRGEIYYYDFGINPGSIQCGRRPVLVLQADNFNQHAPTIIVAAITSVIKKQYMPSHIILPVDCGLPTTSMVMLEQIRTVNKSELTDYIGCVEEEECWRRINNGMKKAFGLWHYKVDRSSIVMTLCQHCLDDYSYTPGTILHRLDSFQEYKEPCTKCGRPGWDYVIFDKRKSTYKKENSDNGKKES